MVSLVQFADQHVGGWSLVAVRSPLDAAIELLNAAADFVSIDSSVPIRADAGQPLTLAAAPTRRYVAVLQLQDSNWSVILRSTGFVYEEDCLWVDQTAKRLSEALSAPALACAGEEICDCVVYGKGRVTKRLSGCSVEEASVLFDRKGVELPPCTIAGDPAELWLAEQARNKVSAAALLTLSVTAKAAPRTKLPLHRTIASNCLDIVKLADKVPFAVANPAKEYRATVSKIVFDPLRIDEVNQRYKEAGYNFDDENLKVIAETEEGAILLWAVTPIYELSRESDEPKLVLYDILDLSFPFKIKNRKAEVDELLARLKVACDG